MGCHAPLMSSLSLGQLAERIHATLEGDGSRVVKGCAPITVASDDDVSFLANSRYARYLESTRAAAVIVGRDIEQRNGMNRLIVDDPYFAFRQAMIVLHGFRSHPAPADAVDGSTKSPNAVVHPGASIGENVIIHPFVTVEAGATVGDNTVLYPNVFVGEHASIGCDCVLYPGVAVYERCRLGDRVTLHANTVIGQDGFGYATHARTGEQPEHHKIPQDGIVVIEDDVECGAACAIERATMGETRIGKGTKFADLISIGHGTTIGEHCLIVSLVGVSGSVDVGKYVVLGGQVGVAGHLTIGDGVQAAGKTGIVNSVPAGQRVGGIPAVDITLAKRNALAALKLSEMARQLKTLEQRVRQLEGSAQTGTASPPMS